MAGATITTLTEFIQDYFQDELTKTFYQGLPLMATLGTRPPAKDGDSVDYRVWSAGHTAINYEEDHTPPAPGNNTYASPTFQYIYAWDVARITGHAIDALKGGDIDPVESEMRGATDGVRYKIENNCVADLISAIDDTTNYGGVNRSTYHLDSVDVAGGSAAPTLAKLAEMTDSLRVSPRVRSETEGDLIVMSSFEQIRNYTDLVGVNNIPWQVDPNNQVFDLGRVKPMVQLETIPWYCIPTLTNTYIFLTRKNDLVIEMKRPITLKELGPVDDSQRVLITCAAKLYHRDPYRAARISALTA